MANSRCRKYSRTIEKSRPQANSSDDADIILSSYTALGILGGVLLLGFVSGALLGKSR